MPAVGSPASFTIGVGACSDWADSPTFDAIKAQDPWLFLFTGDLHYQNIGDNNPATFRSAIDAALGLKMGSRVMRWMPVAYTWDDHDYGPDGSNADNPSKVASHQVYRELVPHWPMGLAGAQATASTTAIAQAFIAGRVRVALSDCRTDNKGEIDGSRLVSDAQVDWLAAEATAAAQAGQVLIWVTSVPWNGAANAGNADRWLGAPAQRTVVADRLKASGATVMIVSGDAHMVAIDDGANTDFATGGGMPMPLLQAAPLNRTTSFKGGSYNQGICRREIDGDTTYGDDQGRMFALVGVDDDGERVQVTFSGRWGGDGVGSSILQATHNASGSALGSAGADLSWSVSYPTVRLAATTTTLTEGSSTVITVSRGGSTASALSVGLQTGSSDLSLGSTTVTIPAGAASATATATAVADGVTETDESILVSIAPARGFLRSGSQGSVTMVVQDAAGPVNTAPTLSSLTDRFVGENGTTAAIPLAIADAESSAVDLVVTASAADTILMPSSGLVLAGSGGDRTLVCRPAADQSGVTTVTVTVTDPHGGSSTRTFLLTVGTLVAQDATWRYLVAANAPSDWAGSSFDDSAWPSGEAELGYGDGDEGTVIGYGGNASAKHITTWFRTRFTVNEPGVLSGLRMPGEIDDGVIAYLNGVEIMRWNMPSGPVTASTLASATAEDASGTHYAAGVTWDTIASLPTTNLVAGENVLAVEVHQINATSSDVSMLLSLIGAHNHPPIVNPSATISPSTETLP